MPAEKRNTHTVMTAVTQKSCTDTSAVCSARALPSFYLGPSAVTVPSSISSASPRWRQQGPCGHAECAHGLPSSRHLLSQKHSEIGCSGRPSFVLLLQENQRDRGSSHTDVTKEISLSRKRATRSDFMKAA